MISPNPGLLAKECSFEELLRQAMHSTLCGQVRWDKILLTCEDLASQDETYRTYIILPCVFNAVRLLSLSLGFIKSKSLSISNALNNKIVKNSQPAE